MRRVGLILVAVTVAALIAASGSGGQPSVARPSGLAHAPAAVSAQGAVAPGQSGADGATHHYLYVFPDQSMSVYDIDHGHALVEHHAFPQVQGIRGVVVSPSTHMLYLSHGNDRDGPGSLLAYDLVAGQVRWDRSYPFGIDSPAITPDGRTIYMPTGELSSGGAWKLIDAGSGDVTGNIDAGQGPHNTVMSTDGRNVYLGGRDHNYLEVASTQTNQVTKRIGPLKSGVRPFTINGSQTLAFTTATGFLGAQVSSISTGAVLYTLTFPGFSWDPGSFPASAPSHGISLSPDERELWVIDAPNSYVHVFDASRLPGQAPGVIANIRLPDQLSGNHDSPCLYDCARDGWLLHSLDGRYVYVGDSGDVIDSASHSPVTMLPALRNTRVFLEVDWRAGAPVATTTRTGRGYATTAPAASAPRPKSNKRSHRRPRHRKHRRKPHRKPQRKH
jgi:DNA-binding beta-propeller fold protein YncE